MGYFNPDDYETVDERIKRFYRDHPQGRILTDLVSAVGDIGKTRWTVKATVYRGMEESEASTGWAFEVDGTGMANRTSALENCETSAIGRALANLNYSGNRRASREEMTKTQQKPTPEQITAMAKNAKDDYELGQVKALAKSNGAPRHFVEGLRRG